MAANTVCFDAIYTQLAVFTASVLCPQSQLATFFPSTLMEFADLPKSILLRNDAELVKAIVYNSPKEPHPAAQYWSKPMAFFLSPDLQS